MRIKLSNLMRKHEKNLKTKVAVVPTVIAIHHYPIELYNTVCNVKR